MQAYTIVHLTPENNAQIARNVRAKHAVSLSGGVPSSVMAQAVIDRYGRENVVLWFADVLQEDDDLYRFLGDCMAKWGGILYWYTDGRTPLELAEEKKLIPCDLHCPCSYELKVKPFRQFIKAMPVLPTVNIGLEKHETKRLASVKKSYAEAIPSAVVEFPLLWGTWSHRALFETVEAWGIDIPRAYKLGFKHNNCLKRGCIRQGIKEWVRLGYYFPESYAASESWEQAQRAQGGPRAERAFCSVERNGKKQPITLAQIREEYFPRAEKLLTVSM